MTSKKQIGGTVTDLTRFILTRVLEKGNGQEGLRRPVDRLVVGSTWSEERTQKKGREKRLWMITIFRRRNGRVILPTNFFDEKAPEGGEDKKFPGERKY